MGSRASSTLALRAALAAAGVAAAAAALHLAAPGTAAFLAASVPRVYASVRAWLTPPYLYFVINGIIISIAASSRFHRPAPAPATPSALPIPAAQPLEYAAKIEEDAALALARPEFLAPAVEYGDAVSVFKSEPPPPEAVAVAIAAAVAEEEVRRPEEKPKQIDEEDEDEVEFVISRSSWSPKRRGASASAAAPPPEKPLVSARFGHQQQRRSVKASPEGRGLRVARPKRGETLESTWKAITDGRAVPLARHLKKSDTWADARGEEAAAPLMRKSETFNERGGRPPPPPRASPAASGGGKLKKDPSLGQDELNRRVEAFINKFNNEMRLQRQESFQHYLDMINRGAHH